MATNRITREQQVNKNVTRSGLSLFYFTKPSISVEGLRNTTKPQSRQPVSRAEIRTVNLPKLMQKANHFTTIPISFAVFEHKLYFYYTEAKIYDMKITVTANAASTVYIRVPKCIMKVHRGTTL
jgi:uncharacterized protein (DUF2132 family)